MAFGLAIGVLEAWISGDYVVSASDYMYLGSRAGFFAGTILAACSIATQKRLLGLEGAIRSFVVLGLVACGVVCIGAIAGLLLPYTQGAMHDTSILAHPRRYSLFLAIHRIWLFALFLGTVVSCFYTWRGRGAPGGVRKRQPEQKINRK